MGNSCGTKLEVVGRRVRLAWGQCFVFFFLGFSMGLVPELTAKEPPIVALAFSADGKTLLAGSQAGIQVYSWPDLNKQKTIHVQYSNLHHLSFSPDGKHFVASGGEPAVEGGVEVFEWPACNSIGLYACHQDSSMQSEWIDNFRLASAGLDFQVIVIDLKSAAMKQELQGHARGVTCLSYVAANQMLVTSGIDQSLRVWDLEGEKVLRSLTNHKQPVVDLELRPSTEGLPMVASASKDKTIRFWQPSIGRLVRFARVPALPVDIVWDFAGSRIFAACEDGYVYAIDPDSVELLRTESKKVSDNRLYALAIHPSGELAVGGVDGQVLRMSPSSID